MRGLPTEKVQMADRVVVTQVEWYPVWWLFGAQRKRMVSRVLKDRETGVTRVLSVRWLTEFETTMFDVGDIHSYTVDYPEGIHCGTLTK